MRAELVSFLASELVSSRSLRFLLGLVVALLGVALGMVISWDDVIVLMVFGAPAILLPILGSVLVPAIALALVPFQALSLRLNRALLPGCCLFILLASAAGGWLVGEALMGI